MLILNVLFFLIWCSSVNTRYILYYSHIRQGSYRTFDCLYAYLIDDGKEIGHSYIRNYNLIPYCRRPEQKEDEILYSINENIAKTISFKELKEQNITSEQLIQWFAPIDIAEKYEMNINDSDMFHNCSSPWFGSMCQYKLDYDLSLSFSDIIDVTFSNQKGILTNITGGTCYRFLIGCNRELWPLCLDWREICNGKIDCINGEDEQWCDQLEMSKCNDNEYRCHYGGQCIPLRFLKDNRLSVDCLDGSDEIDEIFYRGPLINEYCASISSFRCQERIPRYHQYFSCGDGQFLRSSTIPFTQNYCTNNRDKELSRAMLTSMNHISDALCQKSFYCALHYKRKLYGDIYIGDEKQGTSVLIDDIWENSCESLSQHCSSEWLVIPAHPIMFGVFQFVYLTNRSVDEFMINVAPDFLCFHAQRCPVLLLKIVSVKIINGLTCCLASDLTRFTKMQNFEEIIQFYQFLGEQCLKIGSDNKSCPNSSYFYCNQSMKCIPYHRVGDGTVDCFYKEDELFDSCQLNDSNRFICTSTPKSCLMTVTIGNGLYECTHAEDEVFTYTKNLMELLPFSLLCDYVDNHVTFLYNSSETDETNCHWWPCNNPYTHCDKKWNCPNGIDELNCPDNRCSFNEHECQNKRNNLTYCLPRTQIYDTYLFNCTNQKNLYRQLYFYNGTNNISEYYYSWNNSKCITLEKICLDRHYLQTFNEEKEVCLYQSRQLNSLIIRSFNLILNKEDQCDLNFKKKRSTSNSQMVLSTFFFKATRLGYSPAVSTNLSVPIISQINQKKMIISPIDTTSTLYCHRGILLLTSRNQTKTCLCPPNYFGSQCQWQNQRISLTLQLHWRSTASITVIFQVIIMLIDIDGQISPYYEQITYMPNRDCNTKFNIYLLYPHRPKSLSNNYSIRIQIYEKSKLNYWASWFISIPFQFLPVNRIVTQLIIPENEDKKFCNLSCGEHGKCRHYINQKSLFFCQCNQGYSGSQCQIKHQCNCSNDSFCLDSSICICPLNKFGLYCHLKHSICQSSNNPCQHNGLCAPTDDRIQLSTFNCFCLEDYSGEQCQNKNNQIDIHLNQTIISNTSLLLLHFITTFINAEHERITVLKKIPFNDKNLTVYVTQPFNILFIQIPNQDDYYLAILREIFIPSEHIYTKVSLKQRCSSINDTFLQYEYLRRVKYYPLLCRENSQLMCFYDKDLMCICDSDRFSNCFLFNKTMNNNCQGLNHCENGGQCFQNNETCPTKITCICQDCYYGSQCQFTTKGFIISLDSILGYHIKLNLSIKQQPLIIKISIAIIIIMFLTGLISGFLSIITFCRKIPRQVGSGNYLLASSITSILMIILLKIKFWQLILSQMSLINNRSLLEFNCISIDVTLRILLSSSEWLNACVAIERMVSVVKRTHFNRKNSRKISKWIILCVFLLTIITHIHEPIHRKLIDDFDIDEKRIWCFVKYSSSVEIYNSFITFFHLLVPFFINVISAFWIIRSVTHNRSTIRPEDTFQQHLQHQIQQYQHIIITPFILILLSLPRLVISFLSVCMRSAREPWLYLIGYFISFIPSMLIFVVFVLPSQIYKSEFKTMIKQMMGRFRRTIYF